MGLHGCSRARIGTDGMVIAIVVMMVAVMMRIPIQAHIPAHLLILSQDTINRQNMTKEADAFLDTDSSDSHRHRHHYL